MSEKHKDIYKAFEVVERSPEDIRAGLVRVLASFEGELADHHRSLNNVPTPAEDNSSVKSETAFTSEEEKVALCLIGIGLGAAKNANIRHRTLSPGAMWSDESMESITPVLGHLGLTEGTHEEQLAMVYETRDKLVSNLRTAVVSNDHIVQNMHEWLDQQPEEQSRVD